MEFFGTKIRKLIRIVAYIVIATIFIFVVFRSRIDFSIKEEAQGLTVGERAEIEQILKEEFLSVWPFENYAVTFNELLRDKNPNPEYSDVLYTMTIQDSPWPFRYNPVAGERLFSVLAKNKETDAWELVAKICCCMACEEWY